MPSFINGLRVADNGRADIDVDAPAPSGASAMAGNLYDNVPTANLLQVLTTAPAAPFARCGGFTYDANGKLLITTTSGVGVNYHNGLKFTDAGLLYCTPVSPIANYVHGWPVSAAGELCIN